MMLVHETTAKRELDPSLNNKPSSCFGSGDNHESSTKRDLVFDKVAISISRRKRSGEQERRLVPDRVVRVDCRDFPFDAVLSLEDAVKNELSTVTEGKMRGSGAKKVSAHKSKSTLSANEVGQKSNALRQQSKAAKKNRPSLLKCPTWPNNQYSDGGSDNLIDSVSPGSSEALTISKIDSPSFYSTAAIDFSAISHLSEEHDKQVAQENAEKASSKHSYISNSTREKLYGKAMQKNSLANGRSGREVQNIHSFDVGVANETVFTLTSVPLDGMTVQAYSPPSAQAAENSGKVNVTKSKKSVKSMKKTSKIEFSSNEKVIRKRYSSAPAVTVSSVPLSSIQNDDKNNTVIIESHSLPAIDSLSNNETGEEGSKKTSSVPVEKQPLPPEGFKISRYPLKKSPQPEPKPPTTEESDHQKTESSLYRLIGELRKQLQRAEEKICEAENQVLEWKEVAQRTMQAVEVIQTQIEVNKQHARKTIPAISEAQTASKVTELKRWSLGEKESNEAEKKQANDGVVQRLLNGKTYACDVTNNRKRSLLQEQCAFKRHCSATVETAAFLSNNFEEKNKSLLAWLANSDPEDDVDYMSFIETPEKGQNKLQGSNYLNPKLKSSANETCMLSSSSQPIFTQHYVSHPESKRHEILRPEKPREDCYVLELDSKTRANTPLQPRSSFDRLLENFTPIEYNHPSNTPSLGSDGEKTPVSLPLQSPEIPSPLLGQSISDSELHLSQDHLDIVDKNYFRSIGNPENDWSKALDEVDFINQLDDILNF